MLELAAATDGRGRAAGLRRRLPRDARGRLHGGRGVPLPRLRGGARRRGGRGGGRDRLRPPPRGVRARRDRAVPPAVGRGVSRRGRAAPRGRARRRRRAALGARLPAGLARGDRALRRARKGSSSTSTPTSSRARSRNASRSTACAPSSCSRETGCLGPRTTIVHGTHASDEELDLVAEAGSRICACPTTEANLGDGFVPVERIRDRGIGLCIGSDSNVRIDPLEELRELEGVARREALRRNVVPPGELLAIGSAEGAAALGTRRVGRDRSGHEPSCAGRGGARGRRSSARLRVRRRRALAPLADTPSGRYSPEYGGNRASNRPHHGPCGPRRGVRRPALRGHGQAARRRAPDRPAGARASTAGRSTACGARQRRARSGGSSGGRRSPWTACRARRRARRSAGSAVPTTAHAPSSAGRVGWDVSVTQFLLAWHGFPSGPLDGHFGAADALGGHALPAARAHRRRRSRRARDVCRARAPAPPAADEAPASRSAIAPTDRFGPRGNRFHTGLDYPASHGARVRAAAGGVVVTAGWDPGGYGNLVVVRHANAAPHLVRAPLRARRSAAAPGRRRPGRRPRRGDRKRDRAPSPLRAPGPPRGRDPARAPRL